FKTVGIASRPGLSIYGANFKEALEGHGSADPRRPRTAGRAELLVSGAHTFSAARVAHQSDMREIDPAEQRAVWVIIERCKLLQVAKHQASAAEVATAIAHDSRRRGYATIGIDGDDDEAPTRQWLGQIFVTQMIGDYHVSVGAGARERVVDLVITPCGAETIEGAAGGVIAMKKNNQRQFSGKSVGYVHYGPYINGDGSNIGVEDTGSLVFKGVDGDARIRAGRV